MIEEDNPKALLDWLSAVYESSEADRKEEWMSTARRGIRSISSQPEWSRLNPSLVRELLDGDEVGMSEKEIFAAALKWLAENGAEVAAQADRLLGVVRFSAMSTKEKFECLSEAKRLGLHIFVKPYVIQADWYRTCMELNYAEFADLVEFDRATKFVGEGRRTDAIKAQESRPQTRGRSVVSVETMPTALERAASGKINLGTVMLRPRPGRASSVPAVGSTDRSEFLTPLSRIPSEHMRYWVDEMYSLAKSSDDKAPRMTTSSGSRLRSITKKSVSAAQAAGNV